MEPKIPQNNWRPSQLKFASVNVGFTRSKKKVNTIKSIGKPKLESQTPNRKSSKVIQNKVFLVPITKSYNVNEEVTMAELPKNKDTDKRPIKSQTDETKNKDNSKKSDELSVQSKPFENEYEENKQIAELKAEIMELEIKIKTLVKDKEELKSENESLKGRLKKMIKKTDSSHNEFPLKEIHSNKKLETKITTSETVKNLEELKETLLNNFPILKDWADKASNKDSEIVEFFKNAFDIINNDFSLKIKYKDRENQEMKKETDQ